ncbi:MAG: sulfotransferase [Pseudomonadota bacterium]
MMAPPIVIIGAARSGTKFLRDVLAVSPSAQAVPYDVNYVWRYGFGHGVDDDLNPADLTPAQRRFIPKTLYKLAKITPGSDIHMIEKSVSNGLRIGYVDAILPDAHFVHLIRDGRDVTESAMRLWQAPPDWGALRTKLAGMPLANLGYVAWFGWNTVKGLFSKRQGGKVWGPRYPGIEADAARLPLAEVCARQWRICVETARRDLAALPENRVTEIRYEDLVSGPEALARLVARTGLDGAETIEAARAANVRADTSGKWRALPEDQCQAILDVVGPVVRDLGYDDV